MKILIAEDDPVSRAFLCRFLGEYGRCDLASGGMSALDVFLKALKEGAPYRLICLDLMMPEADGVQTLRAIRQLERQYGVGPEARARVIMTTARAEPGLVRAAFALGCEAWAEKPIDTGRLTAVLERLGLAARPRPEEEAALLPQPAPAFEPGPEPAGGEAGYFRRVQALPGHRLQVLMGTGTAILFDFGPRLGTARFGRLRDPELFAGVRTDGNYLIFEKPGAMPVRITASEFMDLVLIDRRL